MDEESMSEELVRLERLERLEELEFRGDHDDDVDDGIESYVYESESSSLESDDESWISDSISERGDNEVDEIDGENEGPKSLTELWGMDPAESMSDWVIEIETNSADKSEMTTKIDVYNIHRTLVSFGAGRSLYLKAQCMHTNDVFLEGQKRVSRIALDHVAAEAVPHVLDFIYSQGLSICLTTSNAVPNLYLADYFDIPLLRRRVRKFIEHDLSFENVETYYAHALILCQEKILRKVEETVVDNIMDFSPQSSLLPLLSMTSMVEIIGSDKLVMAASGSRDEKSFCGVLPSVEVSLHLSKVVAAYVRNRENMLEEDFKNLVQAQYLPDIDFSVAVELIQMERTVTGVPLEEDTNLKKRCFASIESNYMMIDIDNASSDPVLVFLRSCPSKVAIDVLVRCMLKARDDGECIGLNPKGDAEGTSQDYLSYFYDD